MEIKLLGSWVINGCPERYYAVVRYYSGLGWVLKETGWERLFATPEITRYSYSPYHKGDFTRPIPKGREFIFQSADEYLFYCTLQEETQDGWPNPSWAIACQLPPDQLI